MDEVEAIRQLQARYFETYEKTGDRWRISSLKLTRLRMHMSGPWN